MGRDYRLAFYFILVFSFFSTVSACQQSDVEFNTDLSVYNEKNYKEIRRGVYSEYKYVITWQHVQDSNYCIRRFYADSLYSDTDYISFKWFYHNDVTDGPSEVFDRGKLVSRGFMKQGKRHGSIIRINEQGYINDVEFYQYGKRAGIWERCSSDGRLSRKIFYDSKGEFIKQEFYTRDGLVARTEYEPNRLFE